MVAAAAMLLLGPGLAGCGFAPPAESPTGSPVAGPAPAEAGDSPAPQEDGAASDPPQSGTTDGTGSTEGGSAEGVAPAEGGSTDGVAPAEGGSTDRNAPTEGGGSQGVTPTGGGSTEGVAPTRGSGSQGVTPTGGGSTEGVAPAGSGTTGGVAPAGGRGPVGAAPADGGDQGRDAGNPDRFATSDWRMPVDPHAQGPTGPPALPEVAGRRGAPVMLPTQIEVTLTSVATTSLTAETPGEYTGSAVVIGVRVTNNSRSAQPVNSAAVSLVAEDGEMGIPTWAAPNDPLNGAVPPGGSVDGTYVFMLDPASGRPVTVRVTSAAGDPVAVFTLTTP